jgi:DHA3 family tetracycline resistance protein-like MFS transporter
MNTNRAAVLARGLFALTALWGVSVIAFGLAGSFAVALAAYWLVGVARTTMGPLERTWITQNTAPELRATLISMSGQMDAIGQVAGGPVVGVIGTLRSLRAALVTTGVFLFPAALLYTRTLRTGTFRAPATVPREEPAPVDVG